MKKWLVVALVSAFLSTVLHFYLVKRTYELQIGTDQAVSLCHINENFNCDSALLSPYAKVFNIPLSNFGVGFNLILSLLLIFLLLRVFHQSLSFWRRKSFYLAVVIGIASLVMMTISFIEHVYCPFCWGTYVFSFLSIAFLWLAFKKDILAENFVTFVKQNLKGSSGLFIVGGILGITFFLHISFTTHFDIKSNLEKTNAVFIDWQNEKSIEFPLPPIFKQDSPSSKMTIVEFADFLCPACKKVHSSLKVFLQSHKNVDFHFYAYPLDGVCNSGLKRVRKGLTCELSKAVICGERQKKGPAVHSFIFEKQREFAKNESNQEKVSSLFENLTQTIPLDLEKFSNCMKDSKTEEFLKEMVHMGNEIGLYSTPTLYVNGRLLRGYSNLLLTRIYDHLE